MKSTVGIIEMTHVILTVNLFKVLPVVVGSIIHQYADNILNKILALT